MNILKGVKVIDFTHAYAGPFTTINLADFGAEVIKIERHSGDVSRGWAPFKNDYSGYYCSFNRNKKSMTLDITTEEGKEIIFNLVKEADIVCSNFKAGTLEKYGIGYEAMKEIKPDIIYASISGFGDKGVLSSFAAYDNVIQALSGIMDVTGFKDGMPTKIGPAIGDSYTGLMLLIGILVAYYHKLETGKGQKVDVTMLGSLLNMLDNSILEYTGFGKKVTRKGNTNLHYAPSDVYKVKDGYLTLAVKNDKEWKSFCKAYDMNELINDKRFSSNLSRIEHNDELTEIIESKLADYTRSELESVLLHLNIACAGVKSIDEAFEDEHLNARDMIVELDDPGAGMIKLVGNPMKLSKTPPVLEKASPLLGQHTEEILKEMGYKQETIDAYKSKKIV